MSVTITFIDKYNPEQFEIIGLGISNSGIEIGVKPYKEKHKKYRKEIQKHGAGFHQARIVHGPPDGI